ncbi:MAG: adenylosuccinate synthetase [Pyrodictiaceae archaeon]
MSLTVVVGGFFGDEGKGKVVSFLSLKEKPAYVVRTGATNAGHTVVYKGRRWKLRAVPSGFVEPSARLLIARGALIDLDVFLREVEETNTLGRIWMDYRTGVITREHVERERRNSHLSSKIGSTLTGVGEAMSDRVLRRLKLAESYNVLHERGLLADTQSMLLEALEAGKSVLVEASQGYWLSLYHGTYPYVTSRDTSASAALSEIGLGPRHASRIIVVFKSYVTRVGGGPLPGEISFEEAVKRGWVEYATVTGRPRRVAPFNYELARRAVKANSATEAAITKLDKLFPGTTCKKRWEELPREARKWVEQVEDEIGVPVTMIGTGEEAECMIYRGQG